MNIKIRLKRVKKDFPLKFSTPSYATSGSAGMDLHACINEPVSLGPGQIFSIPTGIAMHIEDRNVGGFIFPRSGLAAKHGISMANCVGVIDSDYTGEIICPLINYSGDYYTINPGDRIAQIVFMPIYCAEFEITEELSETDRGAGGFGSTGK